MKKLYQRLWNTCLILLLLCAGVYILLLRDRCNILEEKFHIQSSQMTGYKYRDFLEWYKNENSRYPILLEELVPDYLSSLYDWRLGYYGDPYYWKAIRKYTKENKERPASLETLVPYYVSECPTLEYSCDPNGLDYELSLTSETSSYEFTVIITPKSIYWLTPASL